jgi:hypothetical protein
MLASILPGIRDLRAPLVAGYTCLVSLWLFIAPEAKAPSGDGGFALVYRLGQFVGRAGVIAAASVIAYFLGTLLQQAGQIFPTLWSRLAGRSSRVRVLYGRDPLLNLIPPDIMVQLGMETSRRLMRWLSRPPLFKVPEEILGPQRNKFRRMVREQFFSRWDPAREFRRIVEEIPLISGRMRELAKERFDEFDRLRSEAEFREALTPAVALLTIALCYRWSLWWASMLLFVVWLQREAHRLRVQANTVAIEAVMSGPAGVDPNRDELASDVIEEVLIGAPPPQPAVTEKEPGV